MLSKTHRLVEAMTTALGPLFREQPDYNIIQQAMGLLNARVAQATPETGCETAELAVINEYAKQALKELLKLEAEEAAKKAKLEQGITKFSDFAKPTSEQLAAINGGMGAEARAEAEKIQEAIREEDQNLNNLASLPEGIAIPKELVNFGPVHNDPHGVFVEPIVQGGYGWAESPIHQAIQDHEAKEEIHWPEVNIREDQE